MKFDLQSKVVTPKKEDTELAISSLASPTDAVTKIGVEMLVPFEGQPFKPYTKEKLEELAEDIKRNGIISPVVVRPFNDKYQILAGHNRVSAAKLSQLDTIPCIIKNVDEDTAKLIVVNTNLNQRQEMLPSEKAFAYKMQLEVLKHQGQKLTLGQVGPKLSVDKISEENNESARQIKRYIRLTYLLDEFLQMVDEKRLAFMVGVNLSFLCKDDQHTLYDYITYDDIKISLKQSQQLKELADKDFTQEMLEDFFKKKKKPEKEYITVKMTTTHKSTLIRCLNSQKNSIEPKVFTELLKLLSADM